MSTDRFTIPENIFSPSLSNSSQPGIVDATVESIKAVNEDFYGPLMKNVTLFGGNVQFRGFKERFDTQLRAECDQFIDCKTDLISDPHAVYKAQNHIAMQDWFDGICLHRSTYNDVGCSQTSQHF